MTTIRATCPTCGEVDMAPGDIYLAVRRDGSRYRFVCPACGERVDKAADRTAVALLLSAGVSLGDGRPAIPSIRPGNEHLPPLRAEDARAFRRLLSGADALGPLVDGS